MQPTTYPYPSIWINGRDVSIRDIRNDAVESRDDFEKKTLGFIRRWMDGQSHFTISTSGSTGPSKSITITREQMMASARLTENALGLQVGFSVLVCLDTGFIAGQMMLVRSLTTGMKIYACTPTVNPFKALPADAAVDFAALVPYQVQAVLESAEAYFFDSMKVVIIGGAPLDAKTIAGLQAYHSPCFATYGMTETLTHVALQRINGTLATPYFRLLPGITLRQDERGCLIVSVPHLEDEVVTNDLVELVGEDEFKWLGRWDTVINSGGIKIIPEKVEAGIREAFQELNIQGDFFIFGLPDAKLGKKVALFIEGRVFTDGERKDLYHHLQKFLSRYELPREVVILNSFDWTETGKINRFSTVRNSDKTMQKFTLKN